MEFFDLLFACESNTITNFQSSESRYYVAQTFMRGYSALYPEKTPILLTPYETADLAYDHLEHIYVDKYKAVIDLANLKHCSRLLTMVLPTSSYLLYVAIKNVRTKIIIQDYDDLGEAVFKFIAARLKFRIDNLDAVTAFMELRYGEFYLTLSFNGEAISERLCVVEHSNLKESASTFPSQLILAR